MHADKQLIVGRFYWVLPEVDPDAEDRDLCDPGQEWRARCCGIFWVSTAAELAGAVDRRGDRGAGRADAVSGVLHM
ncbi:hypothetical protein [Trinickia sp.]|uniref:hypothetical protein n=1 Tax=Trinickia sp. TaxID=2571163 RepID=UPI003F7ECD12